MLTSLTLSLLALCPLAQSADPEDPEAAVPLAVVVHRDNPVKSISQKELQRILKAEQQFWPKGKRIYLVLPKSGTDEKQYLLDQIYKLTDAELKRYWVQLVFRNKSPSIPKVMPSAAVTQAVVGKRREAIGIVKASAVSTKKGIRVLAIDGHLPDDPDYPLICRVSKKSDRPLHGSVQPTSLPNPQTHGIGAATPASSRVDSDDERDARIAELEEAVRLLMSRDGDGPSASEDRLDELESSLFDLQSQIEHAGDREQDFSLGPLLTLRGFMDVRLGADRTNRDAPGVDDRSTDFSLGQLDLFVTSELSDRTSALSEIVFTARPDGTTAATIERAILKFNATDRLNLQIGRFHTTLGHWNEAYHHGEWFHTTIGRPQIVRFGGGGGILPIHLIGMVLKGLSAHEAVDFDYTVEFGNGRSATRGADQITGDLNDPKAVNLSVGIRPDCIEGLRFGGGVYFDDIPENTNASAGPIHGEIDERIMSAFATYHAFNWELLAEYFYLDHSVSGGVDSSSSGYYAQVGRKFGTLTPYLRVEGQTIDDNSTYFENRSNLERYLTGLRWDLNTWSSLKLQVAYSDVSALSGVGDEDNLALALQWSYAF